MSDTDARSVAEIMGFTDGHRMWDADDDCTLCGAPPERWKVEHCPNGAETPTPDDMLAFLREQRDVERVGCDVVDTNPGALVRVWFSHQSWPEQFEAQTLHAALEAAVRAVAKEEA